MKKKAVILDLDGVILDTEFILREMEKLKLKGDEKWNYFCQNCNSDKVGVIENIIPFIRSLTLNDRAEIIISTARNEKVRPQTAKKLSKHKIFFTEMYMRGTNDYRDAVEVKKDHLRQIVQDYDVVCFVDDTLANCEMAKELGILSMRKV